MFRHFPDGVPVEELDIIPILVVCESQNKAEMLNGLLRSEGLAVHPTWVNSTENWEAQKSPPELVFYFEDTGEPVLEEVIAAADNLAAAVIVVSAHHDPEQAAAALAAGAAAQVSLADTALLAGIAQRERQNRSEHASVKTLKHQLDQTRQQLRSLMSGGQQGVAYAQEGVIANANPSWAERFGYSDPDDLIGLPVMDLFAESDQETLKGLLRSLSRGKAIQNPNELQGRDAGGDAFGIEISLSSVEVDGEPQIQFTIAGGENGGGSSSAALKQIDKLEVEKKLLQAKLQTLEQREPDSRFLWPAIFAPIAAERVNRPLAGSVRALVAFRPADTEKALSTFGPVGMAEAGSSIASLLSPMLEENDLATRIDGMAVLVVINRQDEKQIQAWTERVLHTLGEHVFETSSRSSILGYAAGIAPIDRVRRLEQLTHQAMKAATGEPNSITRVQSSNVITTADTDDSGWSAMLTEALEEHRFAIALRPIEDLANANKLYEATARLLDREGKEILPEAFMEPAIRLNLAQPVERWLIGHAFATLLRLLQSSETTRVIAPLSPAVMKDGSIGDFLLGLVKKTNARLPVKSLIFELSIDDALQHVADVEAFSQRIHDLHCGFGLRHYKPADNSVKLLQRLQLDALRLDPSCVAKLGTDEKLNERITQLMEMLEGTECRLIASGVNDANLMAQLYNLGISTVEGTA
ncbi:MAG TPA: EAL domain-containing protein, partial [Gammaproteobacteria bacterium]|nr:EAL domain-containing protein [Gammaproteobacteria bacterium]